MDLLEQIVRFEVRLWNQVERDLAERGQRGLGTLLALRVVGRMVDGARVQDLSEQLGITPGAASKLVDRLVRDGLAERSQHPADRRSSLVRATPAGSQLQQQADQTVEAAVGRILNPEAREAFVNVLTRHGKLEPGEVLRA